LQISNAAADVQQTTVYLWGTLSSKQGYSVVHSIDTPTVVHCIGPSLFGVAVADTAGDCKPSQQLLFVSSSLTFLQLLPSSTLSSRANTSDSSVECYSDSYSRWIRTFDAFIIAAIGDVIDVIIFALSRAYLSILCATFGPSMLSNFFELILLLQTLLYCMTAIVAVHAVANSCCLPVVSAASTAPKIICVWFVVVVCSPCITTLLCISYISCLS
jgi:hypothetical protein